MQVGEGWTSSGVAREQLFLATKVSKRESFGREQVRNLVQQQLAQLRTTYIDLYMLHSTHPDRGLQRETWQALEELVGEGVIRHLGVSNFGPAELEELLAYTTIPPVATQNKFSPMYPGLQYNPDGVDFAAFCRQHNILIVGYCVLNGWPTKLTLLHDPVGGVDGPDPCTPSNLPACFTHHPLLSPYQPSSMWRTLLSCTTAQRQPCCYVGPCSRAQRH